MWFLQEFYKIKFLISGNFPQKFDEIQEFYKINFPDFWRLSAEMWLKPGILKFKFLISVGPSKKCVKSHDFYKFKFLISGGPPQNYGESQEFYKFKFLIFAGYRRGNVVKARNFTKLNS